MTTATPERTRLTIDAIVDAADKIIRLAGADTLSMRTLATELGVSTMAAYRHVTGKEQLLALVLERRFVDVAGADEDDVDVDDLVIDAADALRASGGLERELTVELLDAHPDLEHLARWRTRLRAGLAYPDLDHVALALVAALAQQPQHRGYVRFAAQELAAPQAA